jgi:hypothetical protein
MTVINLAGKAMDSGTISIGHSNLHSPNKWLCRSYSLFRRWVSPSAWTEIPWVPKPRWRLGGTVYFSIVLADPSAYLEGRGILESVWRLGGSQSISGNWVVPSLSGDLVDPKCAFGGRMNPRVYLETG